MVPTRAALPVASVGLDGAVANLGSLFGPLGFFLAVLAVILLVVALIPVGVAIVVGTLVVPAALALRLVPNVRRFFQGVVAATGPPATGLLDRRFLTVFGLVLAVYGVGMVVSYMVVVRALGHLVLLFGLRPDMGVIPMPNPDTALALTVPFSLLVTLPFFVGWHALSEAWADRTSTGRAVLEWSAYLVVLNPAVMLAALVTFILLVRGVGFLLVEGAEFLAGLAL